MQGMDTLQQIVEFFFATPSKAVGSILGWTIGLVVTHRLIVRMDTRAKVRRRLLHYGRA